MFFSLGHRYLSCNRKIEVQEYVLYAYTYAYSFVFYVNITLTDTHKFVKIPFIDGIVLDILQLQKLNFRKLINRWHERVGLLK